jgi:uncharacterized membrane protein
MRGLSFRLVWLAILSGCSGETQSSDPSAAAPAEDHAGQVMAAGPPATAGLPAGYQARGQEPGWLLEIDDNGRIDYAGSYGDKRISVPLPAPTAQPDGLSYATPRLTLRVRYHRCNDVMSGQGFAHEVEVTTGGETHQGCGGDRRPEWDL